MANENTVKMENYLFWIERVAIFIYILSFKSILCLCFSVILFCISNIIYFGSFLYEVAAEDQQKQQLNNIIPEELEEDLIPEELAEDLIPSLTGPLQRVFWMERLLILLAIYMFYDITFASTAWPVVILFFFTTNATYIILYREIDEGSEELGTEKEKAEDNQNEEKVEHEVDHEKEKTTIDDELKAKDKRDEELKGTDNGSSSSSSSEELKIGTQVEHGDNNHEKERAKIEDSLKEELKKAEDQCGETNLQESKKNSNANGGGDCAESKHENDQTKDKATDQDEEQKAACNKENQQLLQRLKAKYDFLKKEKALWEQELKKAREKYEKKKDKWEEKLKKERDNRCKLEEEKNILVTQLCATNASYQYYQTLLQHHEEFRRRCEEERIDLTSKLYAATTCTEYSSYQAVLHDCEEKSREWEEEKNHLTAELGEATSSAQHFHDIMHQFEETCRILTEEKNDLAAKLCAHCKS